MFQERSKNILRDLIDVSLLIQQAKDLGMSPDIEVVKTMDKLRQEYKMPTLEALEAEIVKQMPLEDFLVMIAQCNEWIIGRLS